MLLNIIIFTLYFSLDHQVAVIFYLLPYIVPIGRKGRPKKNELNLESTENAEVNKEEATSINNVNVRQNSFTVIVPVSSRL